MVIYFWTIGITTLLFYLSFVFFLVLRSVFAFLVSTRFLSDMGLSFNHDQFHNVFPDIPNSTPELVRTIINANYKANQEVTENIVRKLRTIIDTNPKLWSILLKFEYTSSGHTPSL